MKISKRAQYGLTAMVHLAGKENKIVKLSGAKHGSVSVREISNIEGVPYEFLSKIFSDLEKAKLVRAKYGANGGYVLTKSADKITAMDIVGLLENINTVNCRLCGKLKKCPTRNVWGKVDMAIGKTLDSITLADLIK